jgi:hypothetical protein
MPLSSERGRVLPSGPFSFACLSSVSSPVFDV